MGSYSISEHGRGKWRIKVSLGKDPVTGKYRQRSKVISARTKRDARAAAEEWSAQIRGDADGGTFRSLAEAFMADSEVRGKKPSTLRGYRSKLDRHILPYLGDVELVDLDRTVMAGWSDWVDHQPSASAKAAEGATIGPKTVNQCIGIVRAVIHWAYKRGRITSQECLAPLEARSLGHSRVGTPARGDVAKLLQYLEAVDRDLALLVRLAIVAGARRGELLGLQVGDVDFDRQAIRIERSLDRDGLGDVKTVNSRRTEALDAGTMADLGAHLARLLVVVRAWTGIDVREHDPEQLVFPSPKDPGRARNLEWTTKQVQRAVAGAGLDEGSVWLHGLRHLSVTELADAGFAHKAIARRHGHGDVAITEDVYMGELETQDRAMATALGALVDGFLTEPV